MEVNEQATKLLTVTLDTSVLNHDLVRELEQIIDGLPIYLTHTSVTEREIENRAFTAPGPNIPETGVYGESRWGQSVWGSDSENHLLEKILYIISPGFPQQGNREVLSRTGRHNLRDAMILATHTRSGRDIFVTNNTNDFVGKNKESRRKELEDFCKTQIMTSDEFIQYCKKMRDSE